ncbi:hypothetical protein GVN24_06930 [Rhizobium sp. CRIBSB]|nr:hypothetical protein [Rhizobium sp. CRIBSB]
MSASSLVAVIAGRANISTASDWPEVTTSPRPLATRYDGGAHTLAIADRKRSAPATI